MHADPHFGCERDYGADLFDRDQFAQMADQLRGIRGRFLLSINDHPEVRQIFAGFDSVEVDVRYTIGGTAKAKTAGELIITG